jgi:TPP-dependent pyruvate/acetoin dehydrogenase alpha subunit
VVNKSITKFSLGHFADPLAFHDELNVADLDPGQIRKYLHSMIQIRLVERKLASGRKDGVIKGPVHLGAGQEAIAVGVSKNLRSSDRIFGAHRSHSHLLALGASIHRLFAEVLGRDTGHSRGMGGSMHLWDQSCGFYGSVPIVSGTVPLAVGAGLAAKMQKNGDVAVAYLGDGAVEEGVVHESLNLARIYNIPVIFVVENNLFASHMHISLRQPTDATARFAEANDIPFEILDGNDVLKVAEVAEKFINSARSGGGPAFIEAVTYRWYGHVDWREDIDVGVNRSQDDVENWRARDPVSRLVRGMNSNGFLLAEEVKTLEDQIQSEIDQAWEMALNDPYPSGDALLGRVYASGSRL